MNKNAFSLAVDGWSFLDEEADYVIGGWFGGTRIEGSAAGHLPRPDSPPSITSSVPTRLT